MTQTNSDSRIQSSNGDPLPKPIIKKMFWPFPVIWLVPLAAIILTGFFLRDKFETRGPEITIQFNDGSGLKPGQTGVLIHGVKVGEVSSVQLTDDEKHVLVHVRLQCAYATIARQTTEFWTVRPEVSLQAISGLGAILSGPYIEALPGTGDTTDRFVGLDSAPVLPGKGIHVVLVADRIERVQPETPITYRGIEVGAVESYGLSDEGNHVDIKVFIEERYVPLLRTNSQFWTVSGADIKGGILTGVQVKLGSLSSILGGQIAFATPEKNAGNFVQDGAAFLLHDEPDKEWLKWSPKLPANSHNAADAGANDTPALRHDLPPLKKE